MILRNTYPRCRKYKCIPTNFDSLNKILIRIYHIFFFLHRHKSFCSYKLGCRLRKGDYIFKHDLFEPREGTGAGMMVQRPSEDRHGSQHQRRQSEVAPLVVVSVPQEPGSPGPTKHFNFQLKGDQERREERLNKLYQQPSANCHVTRRSKLSMTERVARRRAKDRKRAEKINKRKESERLKL